jgi:hypothetical protein
LKYWKAALSTAHTSSIPSRFNEGLNQFEILYLGEDSMVAMFESQALLGSPYGAWVQGPRKNWLVVNVEVRLQKVADLTRVSQQALLDTTAQELTGDWRGYQLRGPAMPVSQPAATPAPTQQLGEMLHAVSGLEAFVSLSPKVPTHRILAVFPRKLEPGSHLIFKRDDTGKVIQRLRHTRRRRESRS